MRFDGDAGGEEGVAISTLYLAWKRKMRTDQLCGFDIFWRRCTAIQRGKGSKQQGRKEGGPSSAMKGKSAQTCKGKGAEEEEARAGDGASRSPDYIRCFQVSRHRRGWSAHRQNLNSPLSFPSLFYLHSHDSQMSTIPQQGIGSLFTIIKRQAHFPLESFTSYLSAFAVVVTHPVLSLQARREVDSRASCVLS